MYWLCLVCSYFPTTTFVHETHYFRCNASVSCTCTRLPFKGTSTAYFYSLTFTLLCWHSAGKYGCGNECFVTSAMLITFMLLGKYLEANAKGKASEAIGKSSIFGTKLFI